jgi:hypothetical protein
MLDEIIKVSAQPVAYFFIISLAALVSIFTLPILVVVAGFLVRMSIQIVFLPARLFFARFSGSDSATHVMQPIVAAIFFCFFTSRISEQHRITVFIAVSALILVLTWIVYQLRARYRPHYSEILFDQRFIYPVWDAILSQRRLLTALGGIAPLRPLLWAVQILANQIHHRQWQLFFGTLAVFSIYTLPVQLFPALDRWLIAGAQTILEITNWQWIETSPLLGKPLQLAATGSLYLFDWCVTLLGVFAMIVLFAPLEPRNIFIKVDEALRDYVRKGKIFLFTGYFWQHSGGAAGPAVCVRDKGRGASFEEVAKAIHNETLLLDPSLRGTWQGVSCRVALVYEPAPASDSKLRNSYCFHYRRLGKSSFLVAADADGKRFDGSNTKSQSQFYQLAESIGHLVNIGHSLK